VNKAQTRDAQLVCDEFTRLLRQHGTCPYLPNTPEHDRWQQEQDGLVARAHAEVAQDEQIRMDRPWYWERPWIKPPRSKTAKEVRP
jgi:hypothetical protein